jgi:hypothetical protein
MSQENVEIVRKGIEAWNQHDADLWLSFAAPDIEWAPAGPAGWEAGGAVWKAVHVSDRLAVVDLCTCYGEPVDRLEARDAGTIAYVQRRSGDQGRIT